MSEHGTMDDSMGRKHAKSKLAIALREARAARLDEIDVMTWFSNANLPHEVVTRLGALWDATLRVGKATINVGRIILMEILAFFEEHPHLAVGIALGAAVGALVGLIPILGHLLAPLATCVGIVAFTISAQRMEREQRLRDGATGHMQEAILLAQGFFAALARIFNAIRVEFAIG